MSISSEIEALRRELPSGVKLLAVSKFHSAEAILEAYNAGQRAFAESRPQELFSKVATLPKDIEWHFIGHLQSNKIKLVVPNVTLIHSVDSEKLLREIDTFALSHGEVSRVLLEVFIAKEESKQGFSEKEVCELLNSLKINKLSNTTICGLMGMATFTSDTEEVRREFGFIHDLFFRLRAFHPELQEFKQLSIGMSEDYRIALECGSTCVRIGTKIFGARG